MVHSGYTTEKYAVFGNPISQSKSPEIHAAFAEQTRQNILYEKILGQKDNFSADLASFFTDPVAKGCNVTLPFKEIAATWVDELSPAANVAGAVNTIVRLENGKFRGDNTDGMGLAIDIENQDFMFSNASVLLVGAGGATRGVVLPLLDKGVARIDIANRTKEKALLLSQWFENERVNGLGLEDLIHLDHSYDLIVNCTSASLSGDLPGVPDFLLVNANFVYDMVYLRDETVFLKRAKQLGANKVSDGLGMLVGQAAYSFFLWRGVMPKISPVLSSLRDKL